MYRNLSNEGRLTGGQSSSPPAASAIDGQESSWIGSALSFLQKYLPSRTPTRTRALCDEEAQWFDGDLANTLVLRQLDGMMPLAQHPASQLTFLRCQHDAAAGVQEPSGGSALPWMTADSLREIGIQNVDDMDLIVGQQMEYISTARTLLGYDLQGSVSSRGVKPFGGKELSSSVRSRAEKSRTRWDSWLGEHSSQRGLLSDLSWAVGGMVITRLCPPQPAAETKAPDTGTTSPFVPSGGSELMLGENTGAALHKEELPNNVALQTVQNTEGSTSGSWRNISNHLSGSGAAAVCGEVAVLTPDQDNGYSSLEEEHLQICHLNTVKALTEEPPQQVSAEQGTAVTADMEEEALDEGESSSGNKDDDEAMQGDEELEGTSAREGQSPGATALTSLHCQNKSIAFIMGCPCSDDDSSQSDRDSSDDDDDDDDGFDSEGSSELSDSTDNEDDDEDSYSEADSETERLWRSLCQSRDSYNPQNFTAQLHTGRTAPRAIPAATPPSSTQSTPTSSPDLTPVSTLAASLNPTPSSPPGQDVWDDSTSASEVDEAEGLLLLNSFTSSDPYSLFNFQAPIRTQRPLEAGLRTRPRAKKASQTPLLSSHRNTASPPEYRKEEAEERLDSGFSEPSAPCGSSTTQRCSTTKKVRFCDEVEEFFASCSEGEEDRRGPWEELARDRCRFLRRCQEVELSIAYCLQPQHRSAVHRRLAIQASPEA